MVPLLVSIAAGGLVVGLLVGVIGLLLVRSATPPRARSVPVGRQIQQVRGPSLREERERRSAA